jgi:Zn finger protein HypA/HybF involved in hydrogenase expression
MHDFYLAKELLEKVLKVADKNKLKKINKVSVELGTMEGHGEDITAANLKFNFKMLAKNTAASGAKLEIKKIKRPNFWGLTEVEGEK